MKFAFLIMGDYGSGDRAQIANGNAQIIGVSDIEDAENAAKELQKSGIDCIELCGAFGADGARKIMEATGNALPVGYTVHLPEQNVLYDEVFGDCK